MSTDAYSLCIWKISAKLWTIKGLWSCFLVEPMVNKTDEIENYITVQDECDYLYRMFTSHKSFMVIENSTTKLPMNVVKMLSSQEESSINPNHNDYEGRAFVSKWNNHGKFKRRYHHSGGCHMIKEYLEYGCGGCHVIKEYLEKYTCGGCHVSIDCLEKQFNRENFRRQTIKLEPLLTVELLNQLAHLTLANFEYVNIQSCGLDNHCEDGCQVLNCGLDKHCEGGCHMVNHCLDKHWENEKENGGRLDGQSI